MRSPSGRAVAVGLVGGWVLDRLVGDPRRGHPVAVFGSAASRLERVLHADAVGRGAGFTALAVGAPTAYAVHLQRRWRDRPIRIALLTAACAWTALGGRQLGEVGLVVADHLADGDDEGARAWMPHLVGRDPAALDREGMARAVVESVAENTADAVVGTLVWGALAGPAGIVAHRAANTLDAMVGHRTPRHARFGTASARLDDVLGWLPARVTAGLTVVLAPVVGGSPVAAAQAWRQGAHRHPSPNAGPVEAAAAGALGVTLGGPTTYAGRTEQRGPLGQGPPPAVADIPRAVRLTRAVSTGALVLSVAFAGLRPRRGGRPAPGC